MYHNLLLETKPVYSIYNVVEKFTFKKISNIVFSMRSLTSHIPSPEAPKIIYKAFSIEAEWRNESDSSS